MHLILYWKSLRDLLSFRVMRGGDSFKFPPRRARSLSINKLRYCNGKKALFEVGSVYEKRRGVSRKSKLFRQAKGDPMAPSGIDAQVLAPTNEPIGKFPRHLLERAQMTFADKLCSPNCLPNKVFVRRIGSC